MNQPVNEQMISRLLAWATGATLALCLYIASDALDKLQIMDLRVDNHETRITVLESTDG